MFFEAHGHTPGHRGGMGLRRRRNVCFLLHQNMFSLRQMDTLQAAWGAVDIQKGDLRPKHVLFMQIDALQKRCSFHFEICFILLELCIRNLSIWLNKLNNFISILINIRD